MQRKEQDPVVKQQLIGGEEKKEASESAPVHPLLNKENSPSDHLPRKLGKDVITFNIMTRSGVKELDGATGGFVEEDEKTAEAMVETEEKYKERLQKAAHLIKQCADENPEVDFFLLQEAPPHLEETGTGQDFLDDALKRLNGEKKGKEARWDIIIQHGETFSKCIFYDKQKYTYDPELTDKLRAGIQFHPKECSPFVFREKATNKIRVHFNVHLDPRQGRDESVTTENEVRNFIARAETIIRPDEVHVSGDFNYRMGIGSRSAYSAPILSNAHTYSPAGMVGQVQYGSVDGGVIKRKGKPLERAEERLINPKTGQVIDHAPRQFDGVITEDWRDSKSLGLNEVKAATEDSYHPQLFGDLYLARFGISIQKLTRGLDNLPSLAADKRETKTVVRVEVNDLNDHRLAIQSEIPIVFYEDLIKQGASGVTGKIDHDGFHYHLSLEKEPPASERIYKNIQPTNTGVARQFEIISQAIEEYKKYVSQCENQLVDLKKEKEMAQQRLEEIKNSIPTNIIKEHKLSMFPQAFYEKIGTLSQGVKERKNAMWKTAREQGKTAAPNFDEDAEYKELQGELNQLKEVEAQINARLLNAPQVKKAQRELNALDLQIDNQQSTVKSSARKLQDLQELHTINKDILYKKTQLILIECRKYRHHLYSDLSESQYELRSIKIEEERQGYTITVYNKLTSKDENIFLKDSTLQKFLGHVDYLQFFKACERQDLNELNLFLPDFLQLDQRSSSELKATPNNEKLIGKIEILEGLMKKLRKGTDNYSHFDEFVEDFRKNKSDLSSSRDTAGMKFGKVVLSILAAIPGLTVIFAPISYKLIQKIWSVAGEESAKKIEQTYDEKGSRPRKG